MSKPSRSSRQSLRGLTLVVLVPCLLFSAGLAGWVTYEDLYDVILNDGFEQKLDAVSTGVAAFIGGEDHLALSRRISLVGLAPDPTKPLLWGLDEVDGRLVTVDMVTGGSRPVGQIQVPGASGLAYDAPHADLVTMQPSSGTLFAFAPDSSTVRELGTVQSGGYALALDSSGTRLVVAGPWGLRGYTRVRSQFGPAPTWSAPIRARGVAISSRTGALYALNLEGDLLKADSAGGKFQTLGPIEAGDDDSDPSELADIRALAISPLASTVFGAGRRLLAIAPDKLTFEGERFRRGYRNEDSPLYQKYVVPMRRIRADLDLTYLYTQNLVAGDSIQYILDSTPMGPDFSPIGSREGLDTEADARGYASLMERGLVYSSAIENSVEWGLLKSAFAPILSARGDPVGMVGTDISVSTIRDRTQLALAKVGLVTVLVLFLGGLGSVAISLRLTGPLAAVQEAATRVAAGRVGNPIDLPRLRDLAALTTSFNDMTRTLTSSVNDLRDETRRVASMRTRRYLVHELSTRETIRDPLPAGVSVEWSGEETEAVPGGCVAVGDRARRLMVVWARPRSEDVLQVLAEREEFALLARRTGSSVHSDPQDLVAALDRFENAEGGAFAVVDAISWNVWLSSQAQSRGVVVHADGREEPVSAGSGEALHVPPGSELKVFVGATEGGADQKAESPGWSVRLRDRRSA